MTEVRDTALIYASLNTGPGERWGNSLGRIFCLYYRDARKLPKVDSRAQTQRISDLRTIEITSC